MGIVNLIETNFFESTPQNWIFYYFQVIINVNNVLTIMFALFINKIFNTKYILHSISSNLLTSLLHGKNKIQLFFVDVLCEKKKFLKISQIQIKFDRVQFFRSTKLCQPFLEFHWAKNAGTFVRRTVKVTGIKFENIESCSKCGGLFTIQNHRMLN